MPKRFSWNEDSWGKKQRKSWKLAQDDMQAKEIYEDENGHFQCFAANLIFRVYYEWEK